MLSRALRQLRRRLQGPPPAATAPPREEPAGPVAPPRAVLPFEVLPVEAPDRPALTGICRAAVERLTASDYGPAQQAAWAARAEHEAIARAPAESLTLVARLEGEPVAFARLEDDILSMLYVHPDTAGLGIATLLAQYLEDEARIAGRRTLHVRASLNARRFFEKMGFRETQRQTLSLDGAELEQVLMEKPL